MWGHSGLHEDVWQLVETTAQIGELTQGTHKLSEGAFQAPLETLRWEWPP